MVSDQLLNVLKLCLLALLYLFFLRVLRAVWVEVKGPALAFGAPVAAKPAKEPRHGRRHAPSQLVVVAPDELVGQTFELADELTVGRAAGCQVTLDDTFASQVHAGCTDVTTSSTSRTSVPPMAPGSTGRRSPGPLQMQRGDHLQVGNTVLELA